LTQARFSDTGQDVDAQRGIERLMRVMITRPAEDGAPLAASLKSRGIDSLIVPLMTIVPLPGPPLDLTGVQALLVTSANGVRAFAARNAERDPIVCAVGQATAHAARDAGFRRIATAAGDVDSLADMVRRALNPAAGALLHVAGSVVAGDLAAALRDAGFSCRREMLYEARKVERLPEHAATALREGTFDGVALYSPRTARIFVELVRSARIAKPCAAMTAWCLSAAVAEQAQAVRWRRVAVAARAETAAMVDVIAGSADGAGRAGPDFVSPRRSFPC
jgi:uroporphyrinogen-III synthase